jgi:thioredoxin-like negative regulator of GroEL
MFENAAQEFEADLTGNPNNVEAKYRLAQNLLARGTMERGIQMLLEVIKIDPNFSHARYELGKGFLQQADVAGAISNLEIAVKLEPENADFHFELGRAYIAAGRREEGKREKDTFNRLKKHTVAGQIPQ